MFHFGYMKVAPGSRNCRAEKVDAFWVAWVVVPRANSRFFLA